MKPTTAGIGKHHATALELAKTRARLVGEGRFDDLRVVDDTVDPYGFLLINYLLTRWKNGGGRVEDAVVSFKMVDFFRAYDMPDRSGRRYEYLVDAIERLRTPVKFIVAEKKGVREIDLAILTRSGERSFRYSKGITRSRLFGRTHEIMSRFPDVLDGFGDPAEIGFRVERVRDLRTEEKISKARPGGETRFVRFEDGSPGFARRHRDGTAEVYRVIEVQGDEFGLYQQDPAGNVVVDLEGKPRRIKPHGLTLVLDPLFLSMVAKGEITLLWFPERYGQALARHMKDRSAYFLMRILLTYWRGKPFRWGLLALMEHMRVEINDPKNALQRVKSKFKVCVEEKIISRMPDVTRDRSDEWKVLFELGPNDFLRNRANVP